MDFFKKYGFFLGKFFLFLFGGAFLINVCYYFFLSSKMVNMISMIYLIIGFLIFGFKAGIKANSKGYIVGFKLGLSFILFLLLFHFLFYHLSFKWISIVYFLILLFATILGATIGINRKKEK